MRNQVITFDGIIDYISPADVKFLDKYRQIYLYDSTSPKCPYFIEDPLRVDEPIEESGIAKASSRIQCFGRNDEDDEDD
eukprot:65429-Hanusia_phi.AAC.3